MKVEEGEGRWPSGATGFSISLEMSRVGRVGVVVDVTVGDRGVLYVDFLLPLRLVPPPLPFLPFPLFPLKYVFRSARTRKTRIGL